MYIYNIASGSKGNSTLIFSEHNIILIDAGISKKRISDALKQFDKKLDDIDALLITHEHSDHFENFNILNLKKVYLPFYLNKNHLKKKKIELDKPNDDSIDLSSVQSCLDYANSQLHLIEENKTIRIGDFKILPFEVNHDAQPTFGFIIEVANESLVFITDTGFIPEDFIPSIANKTYYMIESNHDEVKLINSDRDFSLKKRILSDRGHLSNMQCSYYLSKLVGKNTKEIMLMHLSEECNNESLVSEAIIKTFNDFLIDSNKYKIHIANQNNPTHMGEIIFND